MVERFSEQEKQNYSQIIRERVLEIKLNTEEIVQVNNSIIHVFNNDKDKSNLLKCILGEKHVELIKSDDLKLIHQFSLELLVVLAKEVSDNQYDDMIMNLKDNQIDHEIISHIEKLKADKRQTEALIYFSLNMISIIGTFLFYYTDYHKMEFIPILTQLIVIIVSLRLNKEYAIKSGLILTLLNFTLVIPLNEVIFIYNYQVIIFLIIEFVVLGLIVAILPNYINQLFKSKIKKGYRLYLSTFIPSLLFTVILLLGNIYYTRSNHLFYQFNPLYKVFQALFIAIISVQIFDLLNRNTGN